MKVQQWCGAQAPLLDDDVAGGHKVATCKLPLGHQEPHHDPWLDVEWDNTPKPTPEARPDLYECNTCSAKPGSPYYCARCLEARRAAGPAWIGPRPKDAPTEAQMLQRTAHALHEHAGRLSDDQVAFLARLDTQKPTMTVDDLWRLIGILAQEALGARLQTNRITLDDHAPEPLNLARGALRMALSELEEMPGYGKTSREQTTLRALRAALDQSAYKPFGVAFPEQLKPEEAQRIRPGFPVRLGPWSLWSPSEGWWAHADNTPIEYVAKADAEGVLAGLKYMHPDENWELRPSPEPSFIDGSVV